ncbi:MAG: signal peptidase II [Alphaproteobacteria bacterium]|nr:signal peptidase II [Alphaproteobacteria bacterium]
MQRWALIFIVVITVLDQITKQIMIGLVFEPPRVIEVTSFFRLVPVRNTGISFGLFGADSDTARWVLVALAVVIMIALVIWLVRAGSAYITVALVMVIGGAASNVIDRALSGAVIDFLDFHVAGVHWPAFNLADSLIVLGTAMLLYDGLFGPARALR